ncbi:MAG: bifunctional riboflavin kinase/FAD synthetase [Alphaproteobacteria bacterium]|nr:bifunctional riboflavin kinase/FAD synthetase [Alphaproteobacteria bacterium]
MRIFRHHTELPKRVLGAVVALGNFDGVHIGHQAVIGTARRIAVDAGRPAGAMTFEPHPRLFFKPDQEPFRLTPFRIKARLIETTGADFLYMQHFDHEFASLAAPDFVERVLVQGLGVSHVVMGYDYNFGRGRSGDCTVMNDMAMRHGFQVTCVPPVRDPQGGVYSSTRVRQALVAGRPAEAATLLGRYWEIEGRVEHGDARGRQIGFPTANLHLGEYQRPAAGVYAVRAGIDQGGATIWHDGVANIGRRPTFGGDDVLLEAHLFDFEGDLYGRHLRVALIEFIRPEQTFAGLDELKAQIETDRDAAREILNDRHLPQSPGPSVPAADRGRPPQ